MPLTGEAKRLYNAKYNAENAEKRREHAKAVYRKDIDYDIEAYKAKYNVDASSEVLKRWVLAQLINDMRLDNYGTVWKLANMYKVSDFNYASEAAAYRSSPLALYPKIKTKVSDDSCIISRLILWNDTIGESIQSPLGPNYSAIEASEKQVRKDGEHHLANTEKVNTAKDKLVNALVAKGLNLEEAMTLANEKSRGKLWNMTLDTLKLYLYDKDEYDKQHLDKLRTEGHTV